MKIAHRHEQFKIDGPKAKAPRARWKCCRRSTRSPRRPIDAAVVQLMLAGDSSIGEDEDGAHHAAPRSAPTCGRARPTRASTWTTSPATTSRFGIGPAGTGKTYLAVACAVDALERSAVQRIVLTRPAVEAGERLGFLPGDLTQKVDPYLRPLYDALYDLMGFDRVQKAFERNALEIAPLAFMRGRTLNNAFVILDEAQNTTPEQMKMFLTRIGFGAKAVVTGDVSQIDLPKAQLSGLVDAERVLKRVKGIAHHALHQRRRGAASAGGAHRRCLRQRAQAQRRRLTWHCRQLDAVPAVRTLRRRAGAPGACCARHRVTRWMRHALAAPMPRSTVRIVDADEGQRAEPRVPPQGLRRPTC